MAIVTSRRTISPTHRAGAVAVAAVAVAVVSGCDGPDHSEPPRTQVSLVAPETSVIREADDPSIEVLLSFDPPSTGVLVPLAISGTATTR